MTSHLSSGSGSIKTMQKKGPNGHILGGRKEAWQCVIFSSVQTSSLRTEILELTIDVEGS